MSEGSCNCTPPRIITLNKISEYGSPDYIQDKCTICNSTWWYYDEDEDI